MGILDPDNLPAGRQGRDEERIMEQSLRLRNNCFIPATGEVWIKETLAPEGSTRSVDGA